MRRDSERPADFAPVFIVGVGRSGTSLVHSMLAAHSQISFPPETNFIRRYLATNRICLKFSEGGWSAVRQLLAADPYLQRLPFDWRLILERLEGAERVTDYLVYRTLLALQAEREGKARYGDKDPRSVEYLPLLHSYFPEAHVIHVIRDPRDVLASKKKAAWSQKRSPWVHIAANRIQLSVGRRQGPRLFGKRYHELIYEHLLDDPEGTTEPLLRRLGLAPEPVTETFSEAARALVSQEEMAWKKETLGGLLRNNQGKWETSLTRAEVLLTEIACREGLSVGGYPSADRQGLFKALGTALLTPLLMAADGIYRVYRSTRIRKALGDALRSGCK